MIYLQLRGPGGPVKIKCFCPFILPAAVFLTSSPWFLLSQVYYCKSIFFFFFVFS